MFRILANPHVKLSVRLTAKRYSTLEGAFVDMGEGVVIDASGRIVAFHERHMPFITAEMV